MGDGNLPSASITPVGMADDTYLALKDTFQVQQSTENAYRQALRINNGNTED